MALVGSVRDIHRGKQAEIDLRKLHGELEQRVNERTHRLEEANTALRLMLKKEEEVNNRKIKPPEIVYSQLNPEISNYTFVSQNIIRVEPVLAVSGDWAR